jgi:hypothetical protein
MVIKLLFPILYCSLRCLQSPLEPRPAPIYAVLLALAVVPGVKAAGVDVVPADMAEQVVEHALLVDALGLPDAEVVAHSGNQEYCSLIEL